MLKEISPTIFLIIVSLVTYGFAMLIEISCFG
jgi:hypothetical protein